VHVSQTITKAEKFVSDFSYPKNHVHLYHKFCVYLVVVILPRLKSHKAQKWLSSLSVRNVS